MTNEPDPITEELQRTFEHFQKPWHKINEFTEQIEQINDLPTPIAKIELSTTALEISVVVSIAVLLQAVDKFTSLVSKTFDEHIRLEAERRVEDELRRQADLEQQDLQRQELLRQLNLATQELFLQDELAKQELVKQEQQRQEELSKQELQRQDLLRQLDLAKQELLQQDEVAKQELAKQEQLREEAVRQEEQRGRDSNFESERRSSAAQIVEMSRQIEIERFSGRANDPAPEVHLPSLDLALTPPQSDALVYEAERVEDLRRRFEQVQREGREQQARDRLEAELDRRKAELAERTIARQDLEQRLEEQRRRDEELERKRNERMRELNYIRERE